MAVDLSVFQRLRTPNDYLKEEEEFNLRKQLAKAQMMRAQSGGDLPANIKEWNTYQGMTPEQQQEYLRMKRADQIMNLGGQMAVRNPLGGGVIENYQVTPKPEQMPEFQAAQQEAVKGVDLQYNPMIAGAEAQQRANVDLGMAGQIEQQKVTGRAAGEAESEANKKAIKAGTTLDLLSEAESLLPYASEGVLGTAYSGAMGMAGKSNQTTQANERLKLLSGWLVSNVPRMEGPQSNFDVQNYQKMAADLGNTMKPIGDRLAALQGLRQLQQKYAGVDPLEASQNAIQQRQQEIGVSPAQETLYQRGEREFKAKKSNNDPLGIR